MPKGVHALGASGATPEQRGLAACSAVDGIASHRTAAALWRLGGCGLRRLLDRVGGSGRRGAAALRRALEERQSEPSASVLEDAFVALLDRHHVEQPVCQHRVRLSDGREAWLDFADPQAKLDVERDGHRWHSAPTDVARDQRRDRLLVARGWTVLRYSPDDLKVRGAEVVDEVTRVRLALRSRVG